MSIMDGFSLWLGKALAELAMFAGVLALCAIGVVVWAAWTTWVKR